MFGADKINLCWRLKASMRKEGGILSLIYTCYSTVRGTPVLMTFSFTTQYFIKPTRVAPDPNYKRSHGSITYYKTQAHSTVLKGTRTQAGSLNIQHCSSPSFISSLSCRSRRCIQGVTNRCINCKMGYFVCFNYIKCPVLQFTWRNIPAILKSFPTHRCGPATTLSAFFLQKHGKTRDDRYLFWSCHFSCEFPPLKII